MFCPNSEAHSCPSSVNASPWTLRWPQDQISVAERVARRRLALGRDPQDLAGQAVPFLRELRVAGLAGRRVEEPVGPEREPAAVVDRAQRDAGQDRGGVAQAALVQGGGDDPVVVGAADVEEERPVLVELRRHRDAEQPALALRGGLPDGAELGHVVRRRAADLQHLGRVPLGHHGAAVGQERQPPRRDQPGGDGLDDLRLAGRLGRGGRRRRRRSGTRTATCDVGRRRGGRRLVDVDLDLVAALRAAGGERQDGEGRVAVRRAFFTISRPARGTRAAAGAPARAAPSG